MFSQCMYLDSPALDDLVVHVDEFVDFSIGVVRLCVHAHERELGHICNSKRTDSIMTILLGRKANTSMRHHSDGILTKRKTMPIETELEGFFQL